ncbi:MAG TPA: molybdopterin molybdotransferase MoeA, partial [Thermoleophilaceae bacterium]
TLAPGANIRRAGEDVRAGEVVLRRGAQIGPSELAMLAALGRTEVRCGAVPRVAVVVAGDELVDPGAPLGPGQIRDSNGPALVALATASGARVDGHRRVGDSHAATVAALRAALDKADVVCGSGGVSVGEHDHVKPALAELGVEQIFWGVALKPGKPTWFGATPTGALVFGLPGNPVSAMVTFQLFAHPAIRALAGADPAPARVRARLTAPVTRSERREQAIRCRLTASDDGWSAEPTGAQGSHRISSMLGAGALALIPRGTGELAPGALVDAEPFPLGTFQG